MLSDEVGMNTVWQQTVGVGFQGGLEGFYLTLDSYDYVLSTVALCCTGERLNHIWIGRVKEKGG